MLIILLFSCSQSHIDDSTLSDIPVPNWSVSELNTNLQNILEQGLPHAITIRNEYASFLEHRDGNCPNFVFGESWVGTWEADCETNQNATFWGTGIFIEFFGEELPYDMSLQSSFEMYDGERFFSGGGLLSFVHFINGTEESWEQNIGGSYQLSTVNDSNAWMLNTSTSLSVQSTMKGNDGTVNLQGGYTLNDISIHFEDFEWKPHKCTSPKGLLKIRDDTGYWYTLEFLCNSPCAKISWYEETMDGESCLQEEQNLWTQALSIYFIPWDDMWIYYP